MWTLTFTAASFRFVSFRLVSSVINVTDALTMDTLFYFGSTGGPRDCALPWTLYFLPDSFPVFFQVLHPESKEEASRKRSNQGKAFITSSQVLQFQR